MGPTRRTLLAAALVAAAVLLAVKPAPTADAATLPMGFVEEQIVDGLSQPVAMSWLSDGRFLVAEKAGVLKIVDPATGDADVVLDLQASVNNHNDRGLIGLAVQPGDRAEPWVYLAYTYDPPETASAALYWDGNGSHRRQLSYGGPDGQGHRNARVDRVRLDAATDWTSIVAGSTRTVLGANSVWANLGDPFTWQTDVDAPWTCGVGDPATSPQPIDDCLPSDGGSHSIGGLRFAADGSLFVSIGDGASYNRVDPRALRALDPDWLSGKILRIDPDTGNGVPSNPFFEDDGSSSRSKVYFSGLRNPFRFALTAGDRPVTGDVGWGQFEEVNTGAAGSSFGWPCYEGGLSDEQLAARIHRGPGINRRQASYDDLAACEPYFDGSQQPPTWTWCHHAARASCSDAGHSAMAGVEYTGTAYPAEYRGLWFGDVHEQWIGVLHLDDAEPTVTPVSSDVTFAVDMSLGPDGNVHYVSYFGSVHRIRYVGGGNVQPQAHATSDVTGGPIPLTVNFDGGASFDPDLDELDFRWDFGDGATSTEPTPTHVYDRAADITATLTVTDPSGASDTTTIMLTPGNTAPVPTISAPIDGQVVPIDSIVDLAGSAIDAEDGPLSGDSLRWSGTLHHNDHVHDDEFVRSGAAPAGYRFADHDDDTSLEVCLSATDANGLTGTTCVDVFVREIDLTFTSAPLGFDVTYNGRQQDTPFTVRVPAGVERNIDAPSPQRDHVFAEWNIGGGRTQVITTPDVDAVVSADFDPVASEMQRILFVAGTDVPPAPDRPIVARWRDQGHDVTVVDDDALPDPAFVERFDLVWVSSTVVPARVGDLYADIATALATHEAFIYVDNGLATSAGQKSGQTRLRDPESGTAVRVVSSSRTFSWARPATSAEVIAAQAGDRRRAMVFTYREGDVLADGTPSPACRGGFFAGHDTPQAMNDAGWRHFDDLTDFLLECDSDNGINRSPTIEPVADRADTEGDEIDVTVVADDPDGDALTFVAEGLPDGIQVDDRTGRMWGTPIEGSVGASPHVVTLTVSDPSGSTASTLFTWFISAREQDDGDGKPTILFIASTAPAAAIDQPIIERWSSRGFDVTVAADESAPTADSAADYDLVWVSSTVKPYLIADRYAALPAPVGISEALLFDDNGLATRGGEKTGQRFVRDAATGELVAVTTAGRSFSWAVVGSDAQVFAQQFNREERASVFVYDSGDELADGAVTASCRGGFLAGNDTPPVLAPPGWAYFDALTDALLSCAD